MERNRLIEEMRYILGEEGVIHEHEQLRTYECDGLMEYRVVPDLVVIPESAEQVQKIVQLCYDEGIPFVARGSGTGLSGGALPVKAGVLIVMSRMNKILEVDIPNRRVVVEPGVINLWVSQEVADEGYYYAPDPSSGLISSIGGNLAENAGGVHCLKYGFTTNHVVGAEVVLPNGSVAHLGDGEAPDAPGYDLLGAFVGSEGTLGIATKIVLQILRIPESVSTLLAAFENMEVAGGAVSHIIEAGIVPAAIEMMDDLSIEAVEAAVHPGYPENAGAILIVELDGPEAEVENQVEHVKRICTQHRAIELREARDDDERALLWKGRKAQYAAIGRISHNCYVQDGVIPRSVMPQVLKKITELGNKRNLWVANAFHAGDGNLHPLILYDDRVEGEAQSAHELAGEIVLACLKHGGSLTGEHGIGEDKKKYMPKMFTDDDMNTMQLLRCAFDPHQLSNPAKILPTPRLCGEVPGPAKIPPVLTAGQAEIL